MTLRTVRATPGAQVVDRDIERLSEPKRRLERQLLGALTALDSVDLADGERGTALELVLRPAALAAELLHAAGDISAEAHRLGIMASASGRAELSGGAVP